MDDIRKASLDVQFNIAIQTDDKELMKSWLNDAMTSLQDPDAYLIEKAKYIRREGTSGNYKYIYSEKKSTKHGEGLHNLSNKLKEGSQEPAEKTEGEKAFEGISTNELLQYKQAGDKSKLLSDEIDRRLALMSGKRKGGGNLESDAKAKHGETEKIGEKPGGIKQPDPKEIEYARGTAKQITNAKNLEELRKIEVAVNDPETSWHPTNRMILNWAIKQEREKFKTGEKKEISVEHEKPTMWDVPLPKKQTGTEKTEGEKPTVNKEHLPNVRDHVYGSSSGGKFSHDHSTNEESKAKEMSAGQKSDANTLTGTIKNLYKEMHKVYDKSKSGDVNAKQRMKQLEEEEFKAKQSYESKYGRDALISVLQNARR